MRIESLDSGPSSKPVSFREGWRGARLRARMVAAVTHFGVSVAVVGLLAGLILWTMYPAPFLSAAGGGRLLAMVAAVDLCLGPALTLAVFDTRKRSLRMDLALIALVQLAALTYGAYALAMGRPVFLTWSVDRFELVAAAEVDPGELARAPESLRELSWRGPVPSVVTMPEAGKEREQVQSLVLAGLDLHHLVHRYQSYEALRSQVLPRTRPLDALAEFNPSGRIEAALVAAGLGDRRDSVRWAPVAGRKRDLVALIDARQGDLLKVVALNPW